MAEINGTCDERFGAVREALAASLDKDDVGASVAVYVDGEPVADLWGGYADAARTVPWGRDTIVNVWSTTKTMTALCALILADRGEIDVDAPVARYWPEFAAAGKDGVLVRHLLSHTAGLPTWTSPMTVEDLYDRPAATARLAAQPPLWEPGTDAGYHVVTQGFLVGEVIRRVTGLSVGAFLAEEVTGPLGADFHIGLPAEHDHRVAPVIPPPVRSDAAMPQPDIPFTPVIDFSDANTTGWRRAEIPAGNGHGNARSIAAVQSVLACGGTVNGVRLMSPEGCARALEEQFHGTDRYLGATMRYGLGYAIMAGPTGGRTCFWGGLGGSLVVIDLDNRLTFAYAMNQMLDNGTLGDDRALGLLFAAYDGLLS
ncbi:serine hydrolase [Sphaerisporangium krabiense]|uniref:CubicO group peptidase (Beta-lactamase class C family) n=1 Tax=Sphaerisporangium krabiense TaxID=763782 RepID=A0A7W8ZBP5_9ACTN|nr:serine hydrolase domain-containing protein [Sphaerisporangium krabiense]MBB5630975.1 CubicO group peptidase (beta-lactamase class C family) [Sphaerisporangium krabiense]GII65857.1 serine hydrolase [Sphaerisporangium krabiense]